MEQASMPLMGDRKYGTSSDSDKREGRSFEEYSGPLCLCAARLSFQHPKTKKRLQFCVTPSWLSLVSKDANMNDET
jgi:23S rRNA-/tRNA-specific pseudouridylate synthase